MASNKKTKSSATFYIGWIFCVIVLIGLGVFGSKAFYSHANKDYTVQNERQIERLFSQLEENYQIMVAPDNLNTNYVDSLNAMKIEHAQVVEKAIASQIIDQMADSTNAYQAKIESSNRILFIWGTILAFIILLSVFFAYIGIRKQLSQLLTESDDGLDDEGYRGSYMPNNYASNNDAEKEKYATQERNIAEKPTKEVVKEVPVSVSKEPERREEVPVKEVPQSQVQAKAVVPEKDYDSEIIAIVQDTKSDDDKISSLKLLIGDIKEDKGLNTEQKNLLLYKAFFYLAQSFKKSGDNDNALTVYDKLIQTNPNQPAVFFERGNLYRDLGKYGEAITDYNQVLKLYPDSDEGHLNRGLAYLDVERYQEAISDFDAVVKIDDNNAEAVYYRGYAYFNIGNKDKALNDFNTAIAKGYNEARIYNLRGILMVDRGEYPQAVEDFTKAVESDRQNAKTYINRGYVYSEMGEYVKAIDDYNKVLALDDDTVDVIYKRGEAYYYSHDYEKALSDFNKSIEEDSSNWEAYKKRGMTYYRLERYEEAIVDFDKSLSLASGSDSLTDVQELRADAILKVKDSDEVVEVPFVEKEIKEGTDESVYFNQATAAFNKNDFSTAIDYFNKVLNLNPNNTEVLFMKGMAHNYLKQYELAIADFDKSLALSPSQPEVYYNRANTYVNLQKIDNALADYANAIHFNPTIPEVYFNRGNIYYNRGQFKEALQDYSKSVEINPEYTKAYFNRGLAYKTTEQYPQAIADFKKVAELDADNLRIVEKAQKQIDLLSKMIDPKENLEE